jgi:hypothetical protein
VSVICPLADATSVIALVTSGAKPKLASATSNALTIVVPSG